MALKASLKQQNGSHTSTKWANKIGGGWQLGSFDIHVLNVEIDTAMEQYNIVELTDIVDG